MTTKTTIHEKVLEAAYNSGYITGHNDGAIAVYEKTMDELEFKDGHSGVNCVKSGLTRVKQAGD